MKKPFSSHLWFLVLTPLLIAGCGSPSERKADLETMEPTNGVQVFYFHRTARCPDCLKIEALARDIVHTYFPVELESGALLWRPVNVDDSGQEHYVEDYDLITQSLVIAEFSDGKQLRWKKLDKVWELLENDVDFMQYVETEIRDYLVPQAEQQHSTNK